ncbi:centromere protein X-like [Corticium candelabrum]|uniref:centromere protein X-like n=1 Tax=Corticium candelabrum TaxID=121492 RepID=UPI002E266140|nr:centromere protein X-like [Corticium candelabrum]
MDVDEEKQTFRTETVRKLLYLFFKDKKTKVGSDALALTAEMLRIFVCEAAARSAQFAKADSSSVVMVEHLEKTLPQLLLDF